MTEKDLDIAIEKCERIMKFDTRTMQNPVSENGYIFEKVYDLLKFLRQLQFETGTNARVERKKGKWVNCYTDGYRNMCKCSECGARIDIQEEFKSFFCYHCGADMRGEQDEQSD